MRRRSEEKGEEEEKEGRRRERGRGGGGRRGGRRRRERGRGGEGGRRRGRRRGGRSEEEQEEEEEEGEGERRRRREKGEEEEEEELEVAYLVPCHAARLCLPARLGNEALHGLRLPHARGVHPGVILVVQLPPPPSGAKGAHEPLALVAHGHVREGPVDPLCGVVCVLGPDLHAAHVFASQRSNL